MCMDKNVYFYGVEIQEIQCMDKCNYFKLCDEMELTMSV